MNGYNLTRNWYNFKFENITKVRHIHSDMYFYLIDQWNRLGQKTEFGLPTNVTMESLGIGSYNTYKKVLNDLIDFGFIKLIKDSRNQHHAKVIALSYFDKPTDKALDKATIKAVDKPTDKPSDSINKQITKEQKNKETSFSFSDFWQCYPKKVGKTICEKKYNKLTEKDRELIKNSIDKFIKHKPFKDYVHPNPLTYINQKRWLDEVEEESNSSIPEFKYDFSSGLDINEFNRLKKEHEQKYS